MSTIYSEAAEELYTILDFLRWGSSQLEHAGLHYGHGYDNAWDEALALLRYGLKLARELDETLLPARLTASEKDAVIALFRQRIEQRTPLPYITNQAYFLDMPFYVDERVLIPRSPIAELIEQGFSPWIDSHAVANVLDLCTGSACIAIACAYVFDTAKVDAVDISADALAVARQNVAMHHCDDQVMLIESDLFDALPAKGYDIIVSNPPYVSQQEIDGLPQEYEHEPTLALLAEEQGLAIVDKILAKSADYLNDGGILVVEVGNSDLAMMEKYPQLPCTWLEFNRGGSGVFLLTKEQIKHYFAN